MEDKEPENNSELFRMISVNLQGCQIADEGEEDFFKCSKCPHLGECYKTLSEAVATICEFIANEIELSSDEALAEKVKRIGDKIVSDTAQQQKKCDNSMYL